MPFAALINADQLKELGLINSNVEDSILSPIIKRVQKRQVKHLLGSSLYNRIIEGINADDLNADEKFLMDEYVIPLMVVCCDYKAVNATAYQIKNKATGTSSDEAIQVIMKSDKSDFKNDIAGDVEVAKNDLIGYLMDNSLLYPEYNNAECSYELRLPQKNKENSVNFRLT